MNLPETLAHSLHDYDVVDVVAIPPGVNPDVRIKTLEDIFRDFESSDEIDEIQHYLVQVKPKKRPPLIPEGKTSTDSGEPKENDQIYLPDGALNVGFLSRNAELLLGCGEFALARNIYLRIAQAGASAIETSRAYFGLAVCFEKESRFEEARARYEQSIAFHPTIECYRHLAALLIRQKKDRPAAEAIERALALKDLSKDARFDLLKNAGTCWARANELANSERAYKRALELDPSADQVQAELGGLYLQAGKTGEARRKFQDTLAANPRNDQALSGLAMCLLNDGEKRAAHDHFARALEINIHNPKAVYHLVKCAYELKTYATAARIVENYIEAAPVNIHLMYSLGGMQFHLGRIADARSTVERIIQMNPSHHGAKDLLQRIESLSCHGGQGNNGN